MCQKQPVRFGATKFFNLTYNVLTGSRFSRVAHIKNTYRVPSQPIKLKSNIGKI